MIMHGVNPTDMLPGQEKQDITNVFAMATSFHWNNFTRCVHFHPRSQIEWELTTVGVFFSLLLYNTLRTLQKIKLCHYKFNKSTHLLYNYIVWFTSRAIHYTHA